MSVDILNATADSYRQQYDLAFQVSPIILQGGIAGQGQGYLLPITSLTGGMPANLDAAFARYLPAPGSTLVAQSIGQYPFANQAIAANATIQQPKGLSMVMIAPVNQPGGFLSKMNAFTNLAKKLEQHNALGGTYVIATPAFVYYDLVMLQMADISGSVEDTKQVQVQWQLDFTQPIITLAGATAAQNALMQKISSGGKVTNPSWSSNNSANPALLTGVTAALNTFTNALAVFGGGTP